MAETPTGIMMDATYKGKDVTVYSTTGQRRTEADFASAMAAYDKTGTIPEGYTVLEPGVLDTLRKGFEAVNQPLQQMAPQVGGRIAQAVAPTGFAALGEKLGLLGQGSAQGVDTAAGQFGATEGTSLAESVNTPGKLGLTAGLALTPTGPVSTAVGPGKVALSKVGVLKNIIRGAVIGGTGSVLMDAALGGVEPFSTGKVVPAVMAAGLSKGVEGVVGHMMNKYIKPDLHEKVATDILKPIADKYQNYTNDPTLFAAATSSPQKIQEITQKAAEGMRGSLETVTDDLKNKILAMATTPLDKGEQATLRMHIRNVQSKANDILNTLKKGEDMDQTLPDLQKPLENMGKYLYDTLKKKGLKNFDPVDANMATVLREFKMELANFEEGAHVLNAFKRAGLDEGWSVTAMRDALQGQTTKGDVMSQVSKALGMGRSFEPGASKVTEETALRDTVKDVLQLFRSPVRGAANLLMKGEERGTANMLPWQRQQAPLPLKPISIGVALEGQDAIEDFMKRNQLFRKKTP